MNKMSDSKDEIIKIITGAGMISVLASLARALIVNSEKILKRIRIMLASIVIGTLIGIVIRTLEISEFKRSVIISVAAAFGHSLWPEIEKLIIKYVKKGDKINDVLHNNNN